MSKRHPIRPHLREWRILFAETLESLAEKLGCSHSSVLRWERGAIGVDDKTFAEIARVYGITTAELSAPPGDQPKAKQLDRILRAIRDLDADGLGAVATLAERLKQ